MNVKPLENVLKNHVNDAVKEVTIADVLDILKKDMPIQ